MVWLLVACQPQNPVVDEVFPYSVAGCVQGRHLDNGLDGDVDWFHEDAYDSLGRLIRSDARREEVYFSFWERRYAPDGCSTVTESEFQRDDGNFTGHLQQLECDGSGHPVSRIETRTSGRWGIEGLELHPPETVTWTWENTYDGGLLVRVREVGTNRFGSVFADRAIELRYDVAGREVFRETVAGNGTTRVETTWHNDDAFSERLEFDDGEHVQTESQLVDEEGRIIRYEYSRYGNLIEATDTTWSDLPHVWLERGFDGDGDGALDGIAGTTCEGDRSEYCETVYDGRDGGWVTGDLDGEPNALLRQSWVCP